MIIEEFGENGSDSSKGDRGGLVEFGIGVEGSRMVVDAKRAAVGVGARVLFYPTLVYNVLRNQFEPDFHWWDQIDEHLLLGAVPFHMHVLRLKELGVCAVVTLNEPYETLVPTSFYASHGIQNLVLPTRDYLYAPSFGNLCKAADFIHVNASAGRLTYVHCKAGRGRSTTVVLCYLVQYKQMTPLEAHNYVKSRRPRILLASSQWQAVNEFYHLRVKNNIIPISVIDNQITKSPVLCATRNLVAVDENTFVVVSESDLDGYNPDAMAASIGNSMWAEVSVVYRVQIAGQAAFGSLSYLWFRCQTRNKGKPVLTNVAAAGGGSCSLEVVEPLPLPSPLSNGHPCLSPQVAVSS